MEDLNSKLASFREGGIKALEAEYAREKLDKEQGICPNAKSTAEINECLGLDSEITQQNYETYFRAIDRLLQLKAPDDIEPMQAPNRGRGLAQAELLWTRYREVQCRTSSDRYFGGTIRPSVFISCKQDLTRRHLHELEILYGEEFSDRSLFSITAQHPRPTTTILQKP